jgi:hypothetical protein
VIVRNEELMAQVFPYIDNRFKFALNMRTLKYFEEYLNNRSVIKEINVEYQIYESLTPKALCNDGTNTTAKIIKITMDDNLAHIPVIADLMLRSCKKLAGL